MEPSAVRSPSRSLPVSSVILVTLSAGWKPKVTTSRLAGAVKLTWAVAVRWCVAGVELSVNDVAGDVERRAGDLGGGGEGGGCGEGGGEEGKRGVGLRGVWPSNRKSFRNFFIRSLMVLAAVHGVIAILGGCF